VLLGPLGPGWVDDTGRWLQAILAEFGLAPDDRYRIELCAEELATNVVKYGGAPCATQRIELDVLVESDRLRLTQVDSCAPFDPLSVATPPAADSLEALQEGGQGIHLVRSFSDGCTYEHHDGRNRVELVFDLAPPVLEPAGAQPVAAGPRNRGRASAVKIFEGVPFAALEPVLEPLTLLDIADEMVLLKPGDANHSVLLILGGELRIYLDQPGQGDFIETSVGDCVGEMSVIDARPVSAYVIASKGSRLLSIDEDTFLNRLMAIPRVSRNLMSAMSERMRRSDRLTIQRMRRLMEMEQARRELQYARTIQESQLPRAPLFAGDARLDCVGRMCAAREVGGDFYDTFFLDARHLFVVVADVCGKGLPAALFMVRAMAVLRAQSGHQGLTDGYIGHLVASLNEDLCAYNSAQQFLTAFCGVLDLETNRLRYVNAGHNPPAVAGPDGVFRYFGEPINPLVGMVPGLTFRTGEIEFGAGGTLVLYTDGVTEAENGRGGMFGEDRLLACLDATMNATAEQLVDAVFDEVRQFAAAAEPSDDITALVVRRLPR